MTRARHSGPVRWGILGTGRVAADFAVGLRSVPNAQLAAVGSRAQATAERFAAAFPGARAHGSYAALVADAGVDVVYVATPHSRHKEDALLVLGAGKALLCEKPFATSAAEAEEIVRAARQAGLFCMEAMWMRFMPAMLKAQELVRSGAIGELRMLTADFGAPADPDPAHRFFNPALGGGALLDRGIYPLSLAHQLFGAPQQVRGTLSLTKSGVDEQVAALLSFPGGQIAAISATLSGYAANEAVLIGTTGRITIHEPLCRPDRLSLRKAPMPASGPAGPPSRKDQLKSALRNNPLLRAARDLLPGRSGTIRVPYAGNGYGHEAEEVGRCLAAGLTESPRMPLDETVAILRTLDLIRAASR